MKNFYIITNAYKDKELELTLKMKSYIEEKGGNCEYYVTQPRDEHNRAVDGSKIPDDTECIFVIGGDGTLIRAARDVVNKKIPLIGVNMGTLGYLCELKDKTVCDAIDLIMADQYMIEDRMMLTGCEYAVGKSAKDAVALNDIVIHRYGSMQIVNIVVYVNDQYLATYNADGIIIATPTGSTGYSMSAGGPIIDPKASMLLITPISPHALTAKSIVISADDVITIEIGERRSEMDEEVVVSFDGDQGIHLNVGGKIVIRKADDVTRILKLGKQSFLEILQQKMQVYN